MPPSDFTVWMQNGCPCDFLPGPGRNSTRSALGSESESSIGPSRLTEQTEYAARQNNEMGLPTRMVLIVSLECTPYPTPMGR
jgi:hypothetical protein